MPLHYPFRTSYVPGAPRPDLEALMEAHWLRAMSNFELSDAAIEVASHYRHACGYETEPEPFNEYGTLIPYPSPDHFLAALEDGDRILRNHRRMAHRAWVREVQCESAPGGEAAASRAWLCARLHCGLDTTDLL